MKNLYNNLLSLSKDDDTPFYHSDQVRNGKTYRIFSYHFTDKNSWLLPGALESRGITFEIDSSEEMMRIVSRPMQKFFNLGEVDFIEYGEPKIIMNKVDGSLISSFMDTEHNLWLKSKGSLYSEHAIASMKWLDENLTMKNLIIDLENKGYTVNMEWVSPDPYFRIVVYYPEEKLVILNVRHRETGEYLNLDNIDCPKDNRIVYYSPDVLKNLETQRGIEGYVVIDDKDNWYKLKTPWYLERHRAKDFINQPLEFVKLVLKEEADDVYDLVKDQPQIHQELINTEHKIVNTLNHIINNVLKYYNENKNLNRKDYAIKGKKELSNVEFVLAMLYYGAAKEPNWADFFLKNMKRIDWGF